MEKRPDVRTVYVGLAKARPNKLGYFGVFVFIVAGDSLAKSQSGPLPTWISSLGQNTNAVVGFFVRSKVIERP